MGGPAGDRGIDLHNSVGYALAMQKIIYNVLSLMLLVVAVQAFTRTYPEPTVPKESTTPCEGEPLFVDYPFQGSFLEPWACQPQCEDQILRHIVYSNGKATQCSALPECLDWGEDAGVTCKPNLQSQDDSA